MATNSIYDEIFFDEEGRSSSVAARRLVPLLIELLPFKSVLDVGCGAGNFLKVLQEAGFRDLYGVDGNIPLDKLPDSVRRIVEIRDLRAPLDLGRRFDLVLCLEVAEHLDPQNASVLIHSLCAHGDAVLFSAAIPGQGGTDHINEQFASYWRALFSNEGFAAFDVLRPIIWEDGEVDYWYRQNTIFYARRGSVFFNVLNAKNREVSSSLLDVVHPVLYLDRSKYLNEARFLIEGAEERVRDLEGDVRVLRQAELNLTRDVSVLRGAEGNLLREILALKDADVARAKLVVQLEAAQAEVARLTFEVDAERRRAEDLMRQTLHQSAIDAEKSAKLGKSEELAGELSRALQLKHEEVAACEHQLVSANARVEALASALDAAASEHAKHCAELTEAWDQERNQLHAALDASKREHAKFCADLIEAWDQERSGLQEALDAAASEHAKRCADLTEAWEKERSRLQAILDEAARDHACLEQAFEEREGQVLALSERVAQLDDGCIRQAHALQVLEAELAREKDRSEARGALLRQYFEALRQGFGDLFVGGDLFSADPDGPDERALPSAGHLLNVGKAQREKIREAVVELTDELVRMAAESKRKDQILSSAQAENARLLKLLGTAAPPSSGLGLVPAAAQKPQRSRQFQRLMFLNGCPEGESKRYRIENIIEAFAPRGVGAEVFLRSDLARLKSSLRKGDALIIFRTRWDEGVEDLIHHARKLGVPVIFDVDDLVFEPQSVDFIGAVQGLSHAEKLGHMREVELFQKSLLLCSAAIVTTEFLAGRVEGQGVKAFVAPNTLNKAQMEVARRFAASPPRSSDGRVRIGYFSGSATHSKDFEEAAEALLRVLAENTNVEFHLVGLHELGPDFDPYLERIVRHPFMPYIDMLVLMGTLDLVIAPLEVGNPFSEGKSELKIFEAAAVATPCVASATHSYSAVIRHGVDGMLCRESADWYSALSRLVKEPKFCRALGEAAYARITSRFDASLLAEEMLAAFDAAALIALSTPAPVLSQSVAAPARTGRNGKLLTMPNVLRNWFQLFKDWRLLKSSREFDEGWYLAAYPDVAARKADAALHFLRHGAAEGRDPGPRFQTAYYRSAYADVGRHGFNPLVHYLRHGKKEGRCALAPAIIEPPVAVVESASAQSHAPRFDDDDLALLRDEPLFEADWYAKIHALAPGEDPLAHYLSTGWRDGAEPGPGFDSSYYQLFAPESVERGICPLVHFSRVGRALNLAPKASFVKDQGFEVVILHDCPFGEDTEKRLVHLHQGLGTRGLASLLVSNRALPAIIDADLKIQTLLLCGVRGLELNLFEALARKVKAFGGSVIADVATCVLDANAAVERAASAGLDGGSAEALFAEAVALRRAARSCDRLSAPSRVALGTGGSLDLPLIETCYSLYDEPLTDVKSARTICLSGPGLDAALSALHKPLRRLMQDTPDLTLKIIGRASLGPEWAGLEARILFVETNSYGVGGCFSDCRLNLIHGGGTDDASAVQAWLEAAARGVPTIASPLGSMTAEIRDGLDGWIVASDRAWEVALTEAADPERRRLVGDAARERARKVYAVSSSVRAFLREVDHTTSRAAAPKRLHSGKLSIAWIIPRLLLGGGGHRNILRAAYFLDQFGHKVSLYVTDTPYSAARVKREIQTHFYDFDCDVHVYDGGIEPADVIIATHWTTVAPALKSKALSKEVIYFVQDFEPIFTPMGSDYVRAETTYRQGLYCITSGRWCEVFLKRDFGSEADSFQFPVDRTIYHPRAVEGPTDRQVVTFFAKPEMPRRCFELGVMALREVHRLRPDVEIVFFGSSHAEKIGYDFPVRVLSLVPTLDDLAKLYSSSTLGMVFSTSNPSLIPYEMMACGLPVVDLDRGDNAVNYGDSRDIALLANPDPEVMATEIVALLGNPKELAARRSKGLQFVDGFPSEEEMAKRVESLVLARLSPKRPRKAR